MAETINSPVRDDALASNHPRMRGGASYLPPSAPSVIEVKRPLLPRLVGWLAMLVTIGWVGGVGYLLMQEGFGTSGQSLLDMANEIGTLLAPVVMLWLVALFVQRSADQKTVADALRKTSAQVTMPIDKAEARLQAITEAMDRQVKMLGDATNLAISRIDQARQSLRHETEALTAVSARSAGEIDRVGSFLREQSVSVNEAIDLLRNQADKTETQANEIMMSLEDRTGSLEGRVSSMLENFTSTAEDFAQSLDLVREKSTSQFDQMHDNARAIIEGLSQAESTLGRRLDDYRNLSENASTLAETLATPLAQNADLLRVAAIKSAKGMRSATELMQRQLTAYDEAQSSASNTTEELARRIEQQVAQVQEALERANAGSEEANTLSAERIAALQKASDALTDKVARVREDVDAAGQRLRETANKSLSEVGETVAEKFVAMRAEIGATTSGLSEAAQAATRLTEELSMASGNLDNAVSDAEQSSVSLRDLDQQIQQRIAELRELDEMLAEQVEKIASTGINATGAADDIAQRLGSAMQSVDATMGAANDTLTSILQTSQRVGAGFQEEITRLNSSTDGAL